MTELFCSEGLIKLHWQLQLYALIVSLQVAVAVSPLLAIQNVLTDFKFPLTMKKIAQARSTARVFECPSL